MSLLCMYALSTSLNSSFKCCSLGLKPRDLIIAMLVLYAFRIEFFVFEVIATASM